MEFSWTIFGAVCVGNLFWLLVMYTSQQADFRLPRRNSLIPGTDQKLLYLQDFYVMRWGDQLGVPLILNAFVTLVVNGYITNHDDWHQYQWAGFVAIAMADGVGFWLMCQGVNHKPDWGYPQTGETSLGGFLHLPYHGVCVTAALFAIVHMFMGHLSWQVVGLALAGGAIYIVSFVADIKAGNFDKRKACWFNEW